MSSDAISHLIDRIKNMPHPPRRAVYFKRTVTKTVGDETVTFKQGEFYQLTEQYGYPASAIIVVDDIGFYLKDFKNRGTDYMVLIDEDHTETIDYIEKTKQRNA